MRRLQLEPTSAGYSVQPGEKTLSAKLAGGLSRNRLDQLNPANTYVCQWSLGPNDYTYLKAFHRLAESEQEQFLYELLLDNSFVQDHYCYFVKDSWRLDSQEGLTWNVTANIEAVPVVLSDIEADNLIVELYDGTNNWLSLLDEAVSLLPEA